MTAPRATVTCPACKGSGRVPHEKRTVNGVVDPWDLKEEDLCMPCGGSGLVPAPGPEPDPIPVAAIDHGDCCG